MHINRIKLTNFRGFENRTFEFLRPLNASIDAGSFHALIGENGRGKSSALNGIAIGLNFFEHLSGSAAWREYRTADVRLTATSVRDTIRFVPADESSIECWANVCEVSCSWIRCYGSPRRAIELFATKRDGEREGRLAFEKLKELRQPTPNGELKTWPLLAFFGSDRAGHLQSSKTFKFDKAQREHGYRGAFEGRPNLELVRDWLLWERIAVLEKRHKREGYLAVERAILGCVPGATKLFFDADRKELALTIDGATIPFSALSDGQRGIVGMIADLAIRSVLLNPHLGVKATLETPGVVLIDELDLHLHPKWQLRIVDDLRRTFPRVQFIATTHSPFIIQTLRPGELIDLDEHQPTAEFFNKGIETIAAGLMGVSNPEVSPRYRQMVSDAKSYLTTVDEAAKNPKKSLAAYEKQLAKQLAPYADNPAFQAVLEMEREAKLGRLRKAKRSPSKNGHKTPKKDA